MTDQRVTISGAGLAGALAAVLLARRGFEVSVYERRADMRRQRMSAGRSINLALAARGIVALEHAGLFEQLKPILVPMPGRMIHDAAGGEVYQPYSRHPHEFNWSASRAALNMALMDAAEATGRVRILFEHRVDGYDYAARQLLLHDAVHNDDTRVDAPVLIATDGAGSPVRAAMVERHGVAASEEPLGHAYKELTIPAAADGGFRVRKDALHIWPRGGYMLIALPNPDGSFTVTLFMPLTGVADGGASFASLTTPAKLHDFFAVEFPDAAALIPDLEYDFFNNPTGGLGTLRCARWAVGGNTLLLGDAAHALVPFHGQGMNCAFEDVVALDASVGRHSTGGATASSTTDWSAVFADVEARRKPQADAIADMAVENYVEMRDLVRDPRFHLTKKVEFLLEGRFPDRFIPRYSMVMFHPEIGYAEAQRRGALQSGILAELIRGKDAPEQVDLALAERLIRERLC
jgi:kynurenine 3-monooxygenase